ncbi:hypothetical protein vBAspPH44_12 [Alteromonas phage vB_AspP-H4/4]|uniref:Uncharacterized protein n=1 Tax=Alteromonas phage vB_AspP-H4/4 TaxID=2928692 RepID=A0A220YL52_9CAUD|nr:hypothetical protein HOR85_gp12 [Alteromonas phage vB_AspP-H4/4]ASL24395.1 hypothetical protein vBAspPH44_12 [Alteromonas phage vB_AspP-H4/4]
MPVAPHEGKELEYVMNGIKPLALIDGRKEPEQFERALKLQNVATVVLHNNNELTITRNENAKLHGVFSLLNSPKAAMVVRSKEEKQRLMGRIFGYSEEDIADFIKANVDCKCRHCNLEVGNE